MEIDAGHPLAQSPDFFAWLREHRIDPAITWRVRVWGKQKIILADQYTDPGRSQTVMLRRKLRRPPPRDE